MGITKKDKAIDILNDQSNGIKPQPKQGHYSIHFLAFYGILVAVAGLIWPLAYNDGQNKFEQRKFDLSDDRTKLRDSLTLITNEIKVLRKNSDSALSILGNMPYKEMHLDTLEHRKVQSYIEAAGAILSLNKE